MDNWLRARFGSFRVALGIAAAGLALALWRGWDLPATIFGILVFVFFTVVMVYLPKA